jgi:hypothetical protein
MISGTMKSKIPGNYSVSCSGGFESLGHRLYVLVAVAEALEATDIK